MHNILIGNCRYIVLYLTMVSIFLIKRDLMYMNELKIKGFYINLDEF